MVGRRGRQNTIPGQEDGAGGGTGTTTTIAMTIGNDEVDVRYCDETLAMDICYTKERLQYARANSSGQVSGCGTQSSLATLRNEQDCQSRKAQGERTVFGSAGPQTSLAQPRLSM